jgi:type I restriction enzyme S subunit
MGYVPVPPPEQQNRIVAKIEELFSHIDAGIEALKKAKQLLKQYRQSILKAAVTGELTKEWRKANKAKLESASQLLERILKERRQKWEKRQLEQFKAKGKVPKDDKWKKKYKDGLSPTQSDLDELASYDMPESWNLMTVDQLTYFLTDGEHATPPRTDEGIPLLSARNVQDGWLSFEKIDHVSVETHKKLCERLKVTDGDVLLSCSGTVGRSCIAPENSNFSLVRSVAVLRPVLENGEFMSFSLRSGMLQSQIDRKKTQTAQANIFQGKIKSLILSVPPLLEQNEIVRVIKEKFESTERLEKELDMQIIKAEKNKQSALASAFAGKV